MSESSTIQFPLTRVTMKAVLRAASNASGLTVDELCGPARHEPLAIWRHAAMAVARERVCQRDGTQISFPAIGHAFGQRHHTTVMYACRKMEVRPSKTPTAKYRHDFQRQCVREIEAALEVMLAAPRNSTTEEVVHARAA